MVLVGLGWSWLVLIGLGLGWSWLILVGLGCSSSWFVYVGLGCIWDNLIPFKTILTLLHLFRDFWKNFILKNPF